MATWSGRHTITGDGVSPVLRHIASWAGVHRTALGRFPDSSSAYEAALNVVSPRAIAEFKAARSVARMRCFVAGPVTCR
ncbi:hypothetical protein [Embleya sp. NPDC059259]|uniref:hypothetical protein n=1 Tax=unclassified Embleya TaxID=2699296 RepID=UPI003687C72C